MRADLSLSSYSVLLIVEEKNRVCSDGMDGSVMGEVESLTLLDDHSDPLKWDKLNMVDDEEDFRVLVDNTVLNARPINYPPMDSYYFCRVD